MPVFLLTATDENGKRETHIVESQNSQDAYQDLESRASGCRSSPETSHSQTDLCAHTNTIYYQI